MIRSTTTNRLQRTREVAGLSLAQAAHLLCWPQGALSAMEAAPGGPPTDANMQALADLYGCSVAWLRGETAELSEADKVLLRDVEYDSDRATLTEFMEMLSTRDPGEPPAPSSTDRLAMVRSTRDPGADVPRARKVRYVKAQGQTRKHHCHWPGCEAQVPPAMWGCKAHWFRLPKALRDRIWRTYAPGQEVDLTPSAEYLEVADAVQEWIGRQPTHAGGDPAR
jgi:transcriptional regulator with XRE-family HTH domain